MRATPHVDEPVNTEPPTAPGDQSRRLDAVVAELDSLLGALGDVDLGDQPVPFRPEPVSESRAPDTGRPEPSEVDRLRRLDPRGGLGPPPSAGQTPRVDPARVMAPIPAVDPVTRPRGLHRFLTRRFASFALLTLVATLVAYLVGTTLGGVTGPTTASPDDTSVTTPTVRVVTHEFSGQSAATTVWFTAISDFSIESTGTGDGVPQLALETEDGEIRPVSMEGDVSTAIGPGKYRIVVDTAGDWSLRVLRVVGD